MLYSKSNFLWTSEFTHLRNQSYLFNKCLKCWPMIFQVYLSKKLPCATVTIPDRPMLDTIASTLVKGVRRLQSQHC